MGEGWYNKHMRTPEDSRKEYQETVALLQRLNMVREEHKRKLLQRVMMTMISSLNLMRRKRKKKTKIKRGTRTIKSMNRSTP